MFRFTRPTPAQIAKQIEDAQRLPPFRASLVTMESGSDPGRTPHGYAHDFLRSEIGEGARDFDAAKLAFRRWLHFDLGWVRVANSDASIAAGQIVAVEVESFGLWSLNLSRIVDIIDREDRFGFIYTTTGMHIEEGEERFLLRIDVDTGSVWYELEAISRPRNAYARLGYPVTRYFQHRFARDSHRRMSETVRDIRR